MGGLGDRIFDLQTNSLGLRGDEVQQPKPPDRYRILAVGDSCTFGSGAGQSDTYPAQLQRKLAALRPDLSVEVINAGVPGFTFYQMTRYLEIEGYGLEPDAVVLATGFNDASPATAGPKLRSGRSHLLTDREYAETLHARSSLGITRLLWRAGLLPLRTARGSDSELKRRVPLAEYDVGLRRFARQSRQRGAVPVIVSWPLRAQATPGAAKTEVEQVVARYQQTAADSARAAGAPFVDLLPQVRGKPGLFVDTVHMGAAGYGLVAEAVATGLLPHLGPARLAGRDDSP